MGKTILENEAQKLVNKNIVPKFEAKECHLTLSKNENFFIKA